MKSLLPYQRNEMRWLIIIPLIILAVSGIVCWFWGWIAVLALYAFLVSTLGYVFTNPYATSHFLIGKGPKKPSAK